MADENVQYLKNQGPSVKDSLPNKVYEQQEEINIFRGSIDEEGWGLDSVYYLDTHSKKEVMRKFLKVNMDTIKKMEEAELKMIVGKNGFEWTKVLEQEKKSIQKTGIIKKFYHLIKKFI